jgi:hypothetical protein
MSKYTIYKNPNHNIPTTLKTIKVIWDKGIVYGIKNNKVMNKEELITEYVKNGGMLWSIDNISTIRDGGTIMIIRHPQSRLIPLYIHKDNWTLHSEYPPTDENIIVDEPTKTYIFDRLERYKEDCEFKVKKVNNIIKSVK